MDTKKITEIKILADEIRIETLKELAEVGSGHLGGSLDLAEILAVLYSYAMNVDPKNPSWPDRDYLVLSKGHAGPALYATLALKGFFPVEELKTLNQPGTKLPSHCDRCKTPGIDMTAGSLGQGIGVAVGIALGNKMKGRASHTYCIIGDGEMNEGSVWEALLLAPQYKLDNFIVFVDNNGLQIDGTTNDIVRLGDISKKATEFGWYAVDVDGHDIEAVGSAVDLCKKAKAPAFINAHTIKAKGWAKYEGKLECHHVKGITKDEILGPVSALRAEVERLKKTI
jgi:transketolase